MKELEPEAERAKGVQVPLPVEPIMVI